jgi:hypothetical protein
MKRVLVCALLFAGCAAGKSDPTDSFDDLAGLDEKSDAFSSRLKLAGSLTPGQSSSKVSYTKTPLYRGIKLVAKGEARITIDVRTTDGGDAVTWLLDAKYKVLAKNDDADGTTLDSHLVYDLPAGGATYYIVFRDYDYARHHFVVSVSPLEPSPAACGVSFDHPDEPPVAVSEIETLFGSFLGSYQLYDGSEPDCLDWSSARVQAAVAEDVRANSGIDWQDATPPVVMGSVQQGAANFLAALDAEQPELDSYASSSLGKSSAFTTYYPKFAADKQALIGDSATNPSAFLEFHLHVEAEECSQEGWVRVDTRSGEVVILRVHGC